MTIPAITCDEFADRLADFLERDTDESTRGALESHALSCADCGALLADLRALRIEAASLPPLAPSRDLWTGIAERIQAPVLELPGRGTRDAGRGIASAGPARLVRQWAWMSIAAVALIAVSVGTTYYVTMRSGSPKQPTRVATANSTTAPVTVPDSVTPVSPTPSAQNSTTAPATAAGRASSADSTTRPASTRPLVAGTRPRPATARLVSTRSAAKPSAEDIYAREIARLHAVVAQRRSTLDTATVAVIEKNLRVIDSAIAQCRAALAKDPGSRFLLQSLNGALDSKVELLRTAAQLPSHS